MKYRVTMPGFIGYRVKPGQIIELSGPPTIDGLVPVEEPKPEPKQEAQQDESPEQQPESATDSVAEESEALPEPVPEPAAEEVKILRNTRKPRNQVAAAAPEPDDDAPVI